MPKSKWKAERHTQRVQRKQAKAQASRNREQRNYNFRHNRKVRRGLRQAIGIPARATLGGFTLFGEHMLAGLIGGRR